MHTPKLLRLSAFVIVLSLVIGHPFAANAQLTRPTPMGVDGGNEAFNSLPSGGCVDEHGTLGALVTDGTSLYVLSAAHVLALGTGGYFASGSGQPIVQPSLTGLGQLGLINCPPLAPQSALTAAQVATLSTVVPITFNTSAKNSYDVALAAILPGAASSSISGITAFSGTLLSPVNKGLKVQKAGAATGLTYGKVKKILKVAKYEICANTPTSVSLNSKGKVTSEVCGNTKLMFASHIVVTPVKPSTAFSAQGDSGALVLSTGTCPQPVGMVVAIDPGANETFVAPLPNVLQSLQIGGWLG